MTDLNQRLGTWMLSDDGGASSMIIAGFMLGGDTSKCEFSPSTPHDPSDLGRCLRLLDLIPEWKPRMDEMRSVSKQWENAITNWKQVEDSMIEEVGIDWSKSDRAPKTYELMKKLGF